MSSNLSTSIPLFKDFTAEEIIRLQSVSESKTYVKGSSIIKDNTEAAEFFIIKKGSVAISKGGINLSTLAEGKHFGLMAMIDESPRSADATANEDTELIVIPFDALRRDDNKDLYQKY